MVARSRSKPKPRTQTLTTWVALDWWSPHPPPSHNSDCKGIDPWPASLANTWKLSVVSWWFVRGIQEKKRLAIIAIIAILQAGYYMMVKTRIVKTIYSFY